MKVENIIIGKQAEENEYLKEIINIVNNKRINLIIAKLNENKILEQDVELKFLWPETKLIDNNLVNNNSLVFKLCYKNFSILFTGDIEKEAEKLLIEKNNSENILSATILKIAHHGSNTSSYEEFIKKVNPKIALIGVGKNNKFGHPSKEVIERLKNINCKIYRTDKNGEIILLIDEKGKVNIKSLIE